MTALAAAALISLAGCSGGPQVNATGGGSTAAPGAGIAVDPSILPQTSVGHPPAMRVGAGVIPPTNRWYSSLVFSTEPLPVFPLPLSFTPAKDGFSLGLPRVTTSANTIAGGARADVSVTIAGADALPVVTAADLVAVTVAWAHASVTLAAGWPVVALSATSATDATLSPAFADTGGVPTATVDGVVYGVVVRGGSLRGSALHLDAGGSAQLFAAPAGTSAADFAAALTTPVASVTVTPGQSGDKSTTTLDSGTTTVLAMPAERARQSGLTCDLGTYLTVDGAFSVCRGSAVTWGVPRVDPTSTLDLSHLTKDQRSAIAAALAQDVAATPTPPADSYFGPKALYRLANLMTLADQLGDGATAKSIATTLDAQLRLWGDPAGCVARHERCFVYDPTVHGVVGLAPSFGSEDFNDHHFHYGYLLYAAAVAGTRDPALARDIGPVMDLVAADIASSSTTASFPRDRVFDPFAGHSWASGYAPFADGNNQESSSEAVNAWNGAALWAKVRGNDALGAESRWMLAQEADAAERLWLAPDLSPFPGYQHSIVALQWGGKRDYATWFSAEPSAILGIQVIPGSPVAAQYLRRGGDAINTAISGVGSLQPGAPLADYVLMYGALAGKAAAARAWDKALTWPAASIDDGNSRAYMLAWIAAAATT
jgi:hypothetical protein